MASPSNFVEDLSIQRTAPVMTDFSDVVTGDSSIYKYGNFPITNATIPATAATTIVISAMNTQNVFISNGMLRRNFSSLMYNEDYDIDDFDEQKALRNTFSVIRLCLAIFGICANALTCYVLTYKKLWSPTTLLLITLVMYDALFLIASIPMCLVDAFLEPEMGTFAVIWGICYPLRFMAQTGSIYTLGTLTVERYLIVLRPFKARIFCSFGKIKRFIIFIFFFSIIFNIPRCLFYTLATSFSSNMTSFPNQTSPIFSDSHDSSAIAATPSEMSAPMNGEHHSVNDNSHGYQNSLTSNQSESAKQFAYYSWLYLRVYELYISGVFLYLLPYALIPLLNFQLLLAIKKRRHETRSISLKGEHKLKKTKATNREDGLTMIVLGITVCFFFCCLIPAIYKVTQIANVPSTESSSIYLLIATDTMLIVNASTDFLFYCLLGAKFRNAFLHIFCNKSDCVRGGGAGRSPLTNGLSRHSDTYYHTVV